MGHPQVLVPQVWTRRDIAESALAPVGPASGHLAGGHILDLASQQKMIVLCDYCNPKFVPKGVGYRKWWRDRGPIRGVCDGCRQVAVYAHGFIPEALESAVGEAGVGRRSRGRWRAQKG